MADADDWKTRAVETVDRLAAELVALSHEIHAHPELGYEERLASGLLSETLEAGGFAVDRGAYGIETSFAGRLGDPAATAPRWRPSSSPSEAG